jgi:hypothetical protein
LPIGRDKDSEKRQRLAIEQELRDLKAQLDQRPKRIDSNTTLLGTTVYGTELTYYIAVSGGSFDNPPRLDTVSFANRVHENFCSSDLMKKWLSRGASFTYVYKDDVVGRLLAVVEIGNQRDPSPPEVRRVQQSYSGCSSLSQN